MKTIKKIKTPPDFDFKAYFKGMSPDDAYEKYKKIVSKYSKMKYDLMNRDDYYDYHPEKRNLINKELRKLIQSANIIEKYVKKYSKNKYPFIDLTGLDSAEHMEEDSTTYIHNPSDRNVQVIWMPSEKFLEMSHQLMNAEDNNDELYDESDIGSIEYAKNRLLTGRINPPSLLLNEDEDNPGGFKVYGHQGRHRNYANMLLSEENEIPVMVSYPKHMVKPFKRLYTGIKLGLPVRDIIVPQASAEEYPTSNDITNNVYGVYGNVVNRVSDDMSHADTSRNKVNRVTRPRGMNRKKFNNEIDMKRSSSYRDHPIHRKFSDGCMGCEPELDGVDSSSIDFALGEKDMKDYNSYMNKAWVEYKSKHSKCPSEKIMMNEDAINNEIKRIGVKYNKKAMEKAYRRWFSRDEEDQGNQTLYRRYYCPQCDNESESSYDRRRKKMTCDKCGSDVEEIED